MNVLRKGLLMAMGFCMVGSIATMVPVEAEAKTKRPPVVRPPVVRPPVVPVVTPPIGCQLRWNVSVC